MCSPNFLHRKCLKFLKDYDINVFYDPCMANVVVDALRRLSMGSVEHVENEKRELAKEFHRLTLLGVYLMNIFSDVVIVLNR